jgi:hypothetical protein
MSLAPWEQAPPTPTYAPWETPPAPSTPDQWAASQHPLDDIGNYVSGVYNAGKDLLNTSSPTPIKDEVTAPWEVAKTLASGAVAPLAAMSQQAGEFLTGQNVTPYSQAKANYTYQTPNPLAQNELKTVGAIMRPVGSALDQIAGAFTADPEKKAIISDSLGTAAGFVGGGEVAASEPVKAGADAAAHVTGLAPSLTPSISYANDLAQKYNLNLTKGQLVRQAAIDTTDAGAARALQVPSQIETSVAKTPAGQPYADHFADQQNILSQHVLDAADELKAAGFDDHAARLEATVKTPSPGLSTVNPNKMDSFMNSVVGEPIPTELATKLNDLNELSSIIAPAVGKPVTDAATTSTITKALSALGGTGGAIAGGYLGHFAGEYGGFGGAFVGRDIGSRLGTNIGDAITKGKVDTSGIPTDTAFTPADISTMTMDQVSGMAKKAGISTDEMIQKIFSEASSPAAVKPPQSAPAPSPVAAPPMAAPQTPAAPAPSPAVPAPTYLGPTAPGAAPPAPSSIAATPPSNGIASAFSGQAPTSLGSSRLEGEPTTSQRIAAWQANRTAMYPVMDRLRHQLRMQNDLEYREMMNDRGITQ